MSPNVSVVVPIFRPEEEFLEECLKSVENQTMDETELIIVDDSPKSNHKEFVDHILETDFEFINNSQNKGIAASRNIGVKNSTGKYVTILDQDDIAHERKLEEQVRLMEEENIGVSITNVIDLIQETGEKRERNKLQWNSLDKEEKAKLLYENYFRHTDGSSGLPLTTEMVRRDIYEEIGLYDTELFGLNDREFMMRALKVTDIELIDETLLTRRHHSSNASSLQKRLLKDESKFLEKGLESWPEYSTAYKRRKANTELRKGLFSLKNGDLINCGKNLGRGFYTSPTASLKVIKQFIKNQFREKDSF